MQIGYYNKVSYTKYQKEYEVIHNLFDFCKLCFFSLISSIYVELFK
jgi:hypothetical protein